MLFSTALSLIQVLGTLLVNGSAAQPVVLDGLGVAASAVYRGVPGNGASGSASVSFAIVRNFAGAALVNVQTVASSNFSLNAQAVLVESAMYTTIVASSRFTQNGLGTDLFAVDCPSNFYANIQLADCFFADQPRAFRLSLIHI